MPTYIIVRSITKSEFGWFDELRRTGRATVRQRALNFNKEVVRQLFPQPIIDSGNIHFNARCLYAGGPERIEERNLILSEKNWRFCGAKVEGAVFGSVREGDYFIARVEVEGEQPFALVWRVLMKAIEPERHAAMTAAIGTRLTGSMCAVPLSDTLGVRLDNEHLGASEETTPTSSSPTLPSIAPETPPKLPPIPHLGRPAPERRPDLRERLRNPHIASEMMRVATQLSVNAQLQFLNVLQTVATELRARLRDAGRILQVEINQGDFWPSLRGRQIGFVDGGVANLESLGAAPIAIRVGSYLVTPGDGTEW